MKKLMYITRVFSKESIFRSRIPLVLESLLFEIMIGSIDKVTKYSRVTLFADGPRINTALTLLDGEDNSMLINSKSYGIVQFEIQD